MRLLSVICALLISWLLVACTAEQPTPNADTSAPPRTPAETSDPSPIEPISSRHGSSPSGSTAQLPAAEGRVLVAPGALFTLPENWQREAPAQTMRLAQARIPGSAGEAQLTVFYFGPGGGGGVTDNLNRWAGQIEATSPEQRGDFEVGAFKVHTIAVDGTLKPSMMGTGPTTPQPDSGLLGAVVEGTSGPWFFKVVGPAATLAAEHDAFSAMLRSVEQP